MDGTFRHAIVRPPSPNFADGLTASGLGAPSYTLALRQHQRYRDLLASCGVEVTPLEPDARYPDSTFVEDTAVITAHGAILTRPGAPSRAGEVDLVRDALAGFFTPLASIAAPGTLDGGDVCEAGGHVFIGISHRTNEEGARQLADWLGRYGLTSSLVDIRGFPKLLHLKAGLAWLGADRLAVSASLAAHPAFGGYESIAVPQGEDYAANCVLVNGRVLVAAGFPLFEETLREAGFEPIVVEMSEFEKMDGGLSCLSLRF
jgi:dimethylargininase